MKKFIKLIALICVVSLLAGCGLVSEVEETKDGKGEQVPADTVVMTINGVDFDMSRYNLYLYIGKSQVMSEAGYVDEASVPNDFWTQKTDGKTNFDRAKEIAKDNLINDYLSYEKAKKLGIELSEEDKTQISSQISMMKQDTESVKKYEENGFDIAELEEYVTEMTHVNHILPALIEKGELKVDEAQAEKILREEYVKVQHILTFTINPQTNEPLPADQIKVAEERTQEILGKINAGGDFKKLAEEYTHDSNVEYLFGKGEMVAEFERVSFELKVGQVSGPVQTEYGIHIIKKMPLDLKGEQETLKLQAIKSRLVEPDFEKLLEKWKSAAKINVKQDVIDKIKAPTK